MKSKVQLTTYLDRLSGGGFPETKSSLDGIKEGVVSGVNTIPFFDTIDGGDELFHPTWNRKQSISSIDCRADNVDEDTDND